MTVGELEAELSKVTDKSQKVVLVSEEGELWPAKRVSINQGDSDVYEIIPTLYPAARLHRIPATIIT